MATEEGIVLFVQWFPSTIIALFVFVVNVLILQRERQNRQKREERELRFASKYLSISSYCCIALGPFVCLSCMLQFLDGVCLVSRNTTTIFFLCPFVCVEWFQISRLYYCFSADKVHSTKGYPRCVFIIMLIWLFFACILGIVTYGFLSPTIECYLRGGDAVVVMWNIPDSFGYNFDILFFVDIVLFLAMDLMTVLLYWCKIHSFAKYRAEKYRASYQRVQSVLHRVLILTFFYQISGFWLYTIGLMADSMLGVSSTVVTMAVLSMILSISVFLMEDHNTKEYLGFLRFLRGLRLYLCCCCCCAMVRHHYQVMMDDIETDEMQVKRAKTITTMNTRNISDGNTYGIAETGMEMSLETVTVQQISECSISDTNVERS